MSALAHLALEDFAAVVVALLERGEIDRTLRVAKAVLEAAPSSTSVHAPSEPSCATPSATQARESSPPAARPGPSRHSPSSSTSNILSDSSQKRDGRRPFERADGRFAPSSGDDELPPPEWAARKYSKAVEMRPELPPLEQCWPSFVLVMLEYRKDFATIDGLKKAFVDFLRHEKGAKQEPLPFEPPPAPASSRRPAPPPPPPRERPKIEAPLDFAAVFASGRENIERRLARTQASAPPPKASASA